MKITDRINKIYGVEKSFWKNGELTVYYDEDISKHIIHIRVQKTINDIGLIDSVNVIKLLSTEKGTFSGKEK